MEKRKQKGSLYVDAVILWFYDNMTWSDEQLCTNMLPLNPTDNAIIHDEIKNDKVLNIDICMIDPVWTCIVEQIWQIMSQQSLIRITTSIIGIICIDGSISPASTIW